MEVKLGNGDAAGKPAIEEASEANKLWQEYLQKCCEVGQLRHALTQCESQCREIEKNIEVTERAVKSIAHKHKENQKKGLVPTPQTPVETAQAEGAH